MSETRQWLGGDRLGKFETCEDTESAGFTVLLAKEVNEREGPVFGHLVLWCCHRLTNQVELFGGGVSG